MALAKVLRTLAGQSGKKLEKKIKEKNKNYKKLRKNCKNCLCQRWLSSVVPRKTVNIHVNSFKQKNYRKDYIGIVKKSMTKLIKLKNL